MHGRVVVCGIGFSTAPNPIRDGAISVLPGSRWRPRWPPTRARSRSQLSLGPPRESVVVARTTSTGGSAAPIRIAKPSTLSTWSKTPVTRRIAILLASGDQVSGESGVPPVKPAKSKPQPLPESQQACLSGDSSEALAGPILYPPPNARRLHSFRCDDV